MVGRTSAPSLATGRRARALPPSLADAARTRGRAIRGMHGAAMATRAAAPFATAAATRDARAPARRASVATIRSRPPPLARAVASARPAAVARATPAFGASASRRVVAIPSRRRGHLAARAAASDPDAADARDALAGGGAVTKTALAKLKVAELRAELERRGASADGKKPELVDRLLALVQAAEPRLSDAPAPDPAPDASPAPESKPRRDFQRTLFNSRPAERVSGGDEIGEDADSNFSGMELTFLGTSSGSPSFTRNVSSYALRLTDEIWLFDCGEATQHQLMRSHLRYSKITRIFITHMHGDHIFGLPGLICALSGSRAEARRVHGKDPEPLYIVGPPGICDFVRAAIACSRTALGLPLVVTELAAPGNGVAGIGAGADADPRGFDRQLHVAADGRCRMFLGERWPDNGAPAAPGFQNVDAWDAAYDGALELPYWTVHREPAKNSGGSRGGAEGGIVVRAAPLRHPVPCFGYVVDEPDQAGRMDVEKATALGLPPGPAYKRLKNGESVQLDDGAWIHPEQVLGCDRPGRRLCLLGDTCDSVGVARLAMGADVLVHESTFAAYKADEAVFKGHSTSVMAGEFARSIKARNLLLTHFSNRYGTANTRSGGDDGSGSGSSGAGAARRKKSREEEDVDDDMALPEGAPEDMRAAAQEEISLVEGLVREASEAKGDARVVAASDFFSFNVQRRESFDDCDRAKGNRDAIFAGPSVAPRLETVEDARRRFDAGGGGGGYGGGYAGGYQQDRRGGGGGYRDDRGGYQNSRGGRGGGRGGASGGARGRGGYAQGNVRGGERARGFERNADGSFRRRAAGEGAGTARRRDRGGEISTFGAGDASAGGASGSGAGTGSSPTGFDADTASIDSSAFVREFQRRGGER